MRFEQEPPIPQAYYVQKLPQPTTEGQNIIFSVTYLAEPNLPEKLYLNPIGNQNLILHDDGKYPDLVAGDLKYSTLMTEDIQTFKDQIHRLEDKIDADGGVISFTGHDGHFTKAGELAHFDFVKFEDNEETQVAARLIDATQCIDEIKKEKSLFITDISVVEDPARTYNFKTGFGNKQGAWTFGHLLGNIINNPNNVNSFIDNWVEMFLTTQTQSQTGDQAYMREGVEHFLMIPWMQLCYSDPNWIVAPNVSPTKIDYDIMLNLSGSDWHYYVSQVPQNILLENAPFKLTTIVNRMDLRGNEAFSYGGFHMANAGETRFIFTLINTDFTTYRNNSQSPQLDLPTHVNAVPGSSTIPFDWKGLNVIFEYSNPQPNLEMLQDFAAEWVDLSSSLVPPFGTNSLPNAPNFNDYLQHITDQVIKPNAMPNKPNGSAINRIRTNEKIFDKLNSQIGFLTGSQWEDMKWQFRQFELNNNGMFEMAPVTNVPYFGVNDAEHSPNEATGILSNHFNQTRSQTFINWASQNTTRIESGNFLIPKNLTALTGDNYSELINYFVFDRAYYTTDYSPIINNAKLVRHEISLNTCQGCHGGETKTLFTMVAPMVYGQAANYWSNNPILNASYVDDIIDERFYPDPNNSGIAQNTGKTFEHYLLSTGSAQSENYQIKHFSKIIQTVSPFLTGRRYSGQNTSSATWDDDENDPLHPDNDVQTFPKLPDNLMSGLFWVNDPDNQSPIGATNNAIGGSPYNHNTKYGYNDLEMRKKDICSFLTNENASSSNIMRMVNRIKKIPLPLGSH
ncbi:MAG: hypothetical protein RL708_765 [Bacteroidota bacterium]|jgi:hypothetical protein